MLAGVSGDRIGQWARWGHIRSSRSQREPRVYSYEDVAEAMIVHELEELGADLPSIRRAVRAAARTPARRLAAAAQPRAGWAPRTARSWSSRATRPTTSAHAARASRASWRRPDLRRVAAELERGGWAARLLPGLRHIEVDPDRLGGRPVIRGRRIAAQDVATLVATAGGRGVLHDDYDLDDAQIDDARQLVGHRATFER